MSRLTLVFALVFSTAQVDAQSDPGRDAEARGLFEAGKAAFEQGRFQDALGYFERSYQLSKRPQLLYNIGQVHDRLRHDEEALNALQQYLRQVPDATNRSEVEHRIQALRTAMFGTLHFTLSPTNAQVLINGEPKQPDASGNIQVRTGNHEVWVRAPGHTDLRQRMDIRGGQITDLPVTLEVAPAVDPVGPIAPVDPVVPAVTTPAPATTTTDPTPTTPAPVATTAPTAPTPAATAATTTATPQTVQWQSGRPPGRTATRWGWISTVTGSVLLLGGTAAAVLANAEFQRINSECRETCTREEINKEGGTLNTLETLANVGFIAGGSLVGIGVGLFILGAVAGPSNEQQPSAHLVVGPTSIMARGSF